MLRSFVRGASVVAATTAAVGAFGFSKLYVFGDSLSDVGNDYIGSGFTTPAPPYYMGRFSNGPIWVDDLASHLGVGPLLPSLIPGGTDYAYGGATVTNLESIVPTIGQQIGQFGASNTFTSSDLVVLWGGANDFSDGATNAASVASAVKSEVQELYSLGARSILVPNLPALGLLPDVIAGRAFDVDLANLWTVQFNSALSSDLASLGAADANLKLYEPDFYDYVNGIMLDPSAYGFTNTTGEEINQPAGTTGYLFWDGEHPTSPAHLLLADNAIQTLPEPPAYVALGLGVLALVRRRKHRGPAA